MSAAGFHVLGAGSIGLLYAHHLRKVSAPVTLLVRDFKAAQRFEAGGNLITLERTFRGRHEVAQVDAQVETVFHSTSAARENNLISNLIVATKSVDVVRAVRSVQHRMTPDSCLILLQNGVLSVYKELWREVLSKWEQPPHVVIASTTHGCYVTQPFHVFHAGMGSATFADVDASLETLTHPGHQYMWQVPPTPAMQTLLELVDLGACNTASHADLLQQLHMKLAVNCCINPITAILGCLNGHLIQDTHTKELMRAVCGELHTLFGPQLSQTEEQLYHAVYQVARSTARNKSSMYQDILNGRITEIEHLNGYVVRQGCKEKVPTPVNSSLYQLLKARERLSSELSGTRGSMSDPV